MRPRGSEPDASFRAPGLALAALVALTAATAVAKKPPAPPPSAPAEGFDHPIHDGKVVARRGVAPGCVDCHPLDARARPQTPTHAACFGGPCHTAPKKPPDPAAAPVCLACHAGGTPGKKARAVYPPYRIAPDFGLRFDHARHAAPSHAGGRGGCEPCHPAQGAAGAAARVPGAHERCIGCHTGQDGARPMAECQACHPLVAGRITSPTLTAGPYAVGAAFDHARHLGREAAAGGAAADRCLPCHAATERTGGDEVPAPAMTACEGCHDGRAAFSALAPSCRRCHSGGDRGALPATAPTALYEHDAHRGLGVELGCAGCHTLDAAGAPLPPAASHAPCSDAACHADDFRAATPRTCGACHVGTEPWRPLRADASRRPATEFGVEFSHAGHLAEGRPAAGRECGACHVDVRGGPEKRLGAGHAACAGAGCHAVDAGAAPRLAACDGCHVAGLLEARDRRRATARWSAAATFRHARHERAAPELAAPAACAGCHDSASAARTVAAIASPGKPACARCHDGATAFKMTGHGCQRCHARAGTEAR